ncbi:hypothetical protein [Pseudonocardia sp. TRM90224]|uniref:hypothetical protein n=1 Tax=Pseudonocardia sp. TRM90224 TaxID=2812678 RepID=UPI001E4BF525|nr:hypothetical protein [Pseudonocardia sp. TRM90224]
MELRWTRGATGFDDHKAMTAQPHQPIVLTVAVDLDAIASAGPELVATAARVGSEIVQSFGLAEMPQFTPQGEISTPYWASTGAFRPRLTSWATEHGITLE